jgi:hypothetical protein
MEWIDLALDRDGWQELANGFCEKRGIFLLAENPLSSQEGFRSME